MLNVPDDAQHRETKSLCSGYYLDASLHMSGVHYQVKSEEIKDTINQSIPELFQTMEKHYIL